MLKFYKGSVSIDDNNLNSFTSKDLAKRLSFLPQYSSMNNPYRKLYIYLYIANDLINTVSFRKVVEETGKKAKVSASAVKSIIGAA